MADSVGGLYLQVKLQTQDIERQLAKIAAAASKAATIPARRGSGIGTVTSDYKRAEKAVTSYGSAQRRQSQTTARALAQERLGIKATNNLYVQGIRANIAAKTRETTARINADKKVARSSIETSRRLASQTRSNTSGGGSVLGAVGLGAARSGNLGYGAAALIRYGKNVSAAMGGMSASMVAVTGGLAAAGIAAAGTAAAFGLLVTKIGEVGVQSAVNIQLLNVQLEGLLGSAGAAAAEMEFLFQTAMDSTVPYEALVQLDRALANAGITATTLRRDLVTSVADLGTALGLTADQMGGLVYALQQTAQIGTLFRIDLRQLGNNGIAVDKIMTAMAEVTGKTVAQMQQDLSDGGIDAQTFFAGLTLMADEYAGAADKARMTVTGLMQNIQETFTVGLGTLFDNAGVADSIAGLLQGIQDAVKNIITAAQPTAEAFNNLFQAIGDALNIESLSGRGGSFIDTLFGEIIPGAVNAAAAAIRGFGQVLEAIGPLVSEAFNAARAVLAAFGDTLRELYPLLGPGFIVVMSGAIAGLTALTVALRVTAMTFLIFTYNALAAFRALRGDWDGAKAALDEGGEKIKQQAEGIAEALKAAASAASTLSKFDFDAMFPETDPKTATPKYESNPTTGLGTALTSEQTTAIDELTQSMRSFQGTRSEFVAGLLGTGAAFTATADQITSASIDIVASVQTALGLSNRDPFLQWIVGQTRQLARLAEQREAIADQLSAAQSKLNEAVAARDSFADSIRNAATSFVNDFNDSAEKVWTWTTRTQNGVRTWMGVQREGSNAFAADLKKRLADYKAWVANIRLLQARGLDKDLVQQLIEAGPAGSGATAAALAAARPQEIAEINKTQGELKSVAQTFADEQAGIYYGGGVAAAQSLVSGLKGQQAAIEAQATAIGNGLASAITTAMAAEEANAIQAGKKVGLGFSDAADLYSQGGAAGVIPNAAEQGPLLLSATAWGKALGDATARGFRTGWSGVLGEQPAPPSWSAPTGGRIPGMARGGIVTRPTLALVGESGPEAVVPLSGGATSTDLGGGATLVEVYIGNERITDIVDTRITRHDRTVTATAKRGRRF